MVDSQVLVLNNVSLGGVFESRQIVTNGRDRDDWARFKIEAWLLKCINVDKKYTDSKTQNWLRF